MCSIPRKYKHFFQVEQTTKLLEKTNGIINNPHYWKWNKENTLFTNTKSYYII